MQIRARDSAAYYSCDDHFVVVDKTVDYGRGGAMPDKTSAPEVRAQARPFGGSTTSYATGMFIYSLHMSFYVIQQICFFFILPLQDSIHLCNSYG